MPDPLPTAISINTGLPADLKENFNSGQPVIALLTGILRELQRINGTMLNPVPTPSPPPASSISTT
jgi:hypothetical protein